MDTQKEINELANRASQVFSHTNIDNITEALRQSADLIITRLHVEIFRTNFLDFFLDPVKVTDPRYLERWNQISSFGRLPVNLVDDSGKVVIQVPPLQSYVAAEIKSHRDLRLENGLKEAEAKKDTGVGVRDQIVERTLNETMQPELSQETLLQVQQQWVDLFKYFGYQLDMKKSTGASVPPDEPGDDYGF